MREDIIPIKHGTIETENGLTINVGEGWFVKEPSEEVEELYNNIFEINKEKSRNNLKFAQRRGKIIKKANKKTI